MAKKKTKAKTFGQIAEQLEVVTQDMEAAKKSVESLPDDVEMTLQDEDILEETRHQALNLAHEIEALFDQRNGGKPPRE